MSRKHDIARELSDSWERGVEAASAGTSTQDDLSDAMLGEAAGLRVRSGVQAGGLWSASCGATCTSCAQTCGCVNNQRGWL